MAPKFRDQTTTNDRTVRFPRTPWLITGISLIIVMLVLAVALSIVINVAVEPARPTPQSGSVLPIYHIRRTIQP